ncbi:cytochrome b/b6 domain-containing protein [Sphingomonas sp. 28-62-11]|uniref:cytochrome b/b6 domain-containing protein n=1 Tax=Sphingomonas sp. 28-62-11 TaxID=1970432 RepID=UPI000BC39EBC|nr:MAG: cytochrome B [Sphingomonas sp. 28-62-11]
MTAIEARPRRWDAVVQVTHWSIAAAILVNALIVEEGSGAHVWVGYALVAVLAVRLIWGFIGPKPARFTAFPPSPGRAVAHIGDIVAGRKPVHASHNPLGALMVYAIWGTLGVVIASGIAMAGLPDTATLRTIASPSAMVATESGDEAGEREGSEQGEDQEELLEEVHEMAVNVLYLLILLHIAGVIFESRRSGRHIVMAMIPGPR